MNRKTQNSESSNYKDRSFSTQAQLAFRRGSRRRMLGAGLAALVALGTLILLGPSQEEVKKRFEYYGAPGDLEIMPEINIEDGQDQVRQLPKTLQAPPPPAQIEIEPEDLSENAENPRPPEATKDENQTQDWPSVEPDPTSELIETNQVKLALPRQSNPDWYILHQVSPEYPFTASETEKRIPVLQVVVAIFVDREGNVTDAMIHSTTAGRAYTSEVLEKIVQWKFGWRVDPQAGRWIKIPFDFYSPYTVRSRGNN